MAAERRQRDKPGVTVRSDEPIIALFLSDDSDEVTYFFSEEDADAAVSPEMRKAAREVVGAWSNLDWDEVEAELYRIRHSNKPTPPIELDL
jgi:hypothetical protein